MKIIAFSISFILLFPLFAKSQQPGTIDTSFVNHGTFNNLNVNSSAVQPDGKIMVSGDFTHYGYQYFNQLARLNADGTLDATFSTGVGADSTITAFVLQPDGKIIVTGLFSNYNNIIRKRIARLNSDGSLDLSFDPANLLSYDGLCLYLQSDNKILVAEKYYVYRLNADGTKDATFTAVSALGLGNKVMSMNCQSNGKIIITGSFTTVNGNTNQGIARINADGSYDNTFITGTGFNNPSLIAKVQADDKIVAGGNFTSYNGTSKSAILRLNADGTIDNTYNVGTGANGIVSTIAIQPDAKIILSGSFSQYQNYAKSIVRTNMDGSVDNTFNSLVVNNAASSITILPDNSIILTGYFSKFGTLIKNKIVKITTTGAVDNSFEPGYNLDADITDLAIDGDGKIVAVGNFTSYNTSNAGKIIRFNVNGEIDNTFSTGSGFNSSPTKVLVQSDNKYIVLGDFTTYQSVSQNFIVRLNNDGSLDNSLNIGAGPNSYVYRGVQQSDGKIIIIGAFNKYNGTARNYIARINTDGSIDNSFIPGTSANNDIYSIALQGDGKIIIGGNFTSYTGISVNRICRLHADGSLDHTFNSGTGANASVACITLYANGGILIGGDFTNYNGTASKRIARLNNDGSIDNSFVTNLNATSTVTEIKLQNEEIIMVGGNFNQKIVPPSNLNAFALLAKNGSIDNSFKLGTAFLSNSYSSVSSSVSSIELTKDNKIVVGGFFVNYNGVLVQYITRLNGYPSGYNTIRGKVFEDINKNCLYENTENIIPDVIVCAKPGNFYASVIQDEYKLRVDSGTKIYTISQILNPTKTKALIQECPAGDYTISLESFGKDTASFDFADSIRNCSLLTIDLESERRRRCARNYTYVKYSNEGNKAALNTEVKIIYPEYMIPLYSTPTWTSKSGNTVTYNIGTLNVLSKGSITIVDSVICGNTAILGLTQCIKAVITPVEDCTQDNASWDHSSIEVSGECQNNLLLYSIKNIGTGDMADSSDFRVYMNDTIIRRGKFKLLSQDSLLISVNSGKQTVRLEADQSPLHPGSSKPKVILENCGIGNIIKGLVQSIPQDDEDENVSISCLPIRDSYDPNDKQADPVGLTLAHYINATDKIEYTIRFQNTGTDTAHTVNIVDTLDANLDIATFISGVSSHNYNMEISGQGNPIVTFRFANINLPDSTTNKAASQGFIKYSLRPITATTTGTIIHNNAGIYFDYNIPVITNKTTHTIGNWEYQDNSRSGLVSVGGIYTTGINKSYWNSLNIEVYPNPAQEELTIESTIPISDIRLYNIVGEEITSTPVLIGKNKISLGLLPKGIYLYEIYNQETIMSLGKIVKQ